MTLGRGRSQDGGGDGLVTVGQYAAHAGISRQAVSRLLKKGALPVAEMRGTRRMLDPAACDAARASNVDPAHRPPSTDEPSARASSPQAAHGSGGPSSFLDERARKTAAEADIAELKRDEMCRRLVDRRAALSAFRGVASEVKGRLRTQSARVTPMLLALPELACVPPEAAHAIRTVLDREMDADLTALSEVPELLGGDEAEPGADA